MSDDIISLCWKSKIFVDKEGKPGKTQQLPFPAVFGKRNSVSEEDPGPWPAVQKEAAKPKRELEAQTCKAVGRNIEKEETLIMPSRKLNSRNLTLYYFPLQRR